MKCISEHAPDQQFTNLTACGRKKEVVDNSVSSAFMTQEPFS